MEHVGQPASSAPKAVLSDLIIPENRKRKLPTSSGLQFKLARLDERKTCVSNQDKNFECPVCFTNVLRYKGVILRNCLHQFCRDCLNGSIRYSEDAETKCPYMDANYSCVSILQDREIRGLISKKDYEKHLEKSLRLAMGSLGQVFNCLTPNCRGFCEIEGNVQSFGCYLCHKQNCIKCKAIHENMTCIQYQDIVKSGDNPDQVSSQLALAKMISDGEAMKCPQCSALLSKIEGCDFIQCSYCKTGICWVTKKPRHGPNGCKCNVNGVKCHPKCRNCH